MLFFFNCHLKRSWHWNINNKYPPHPSEAERDGKWKWAPPPRVRSFCFVSKCEFLFLLIILKYLNRFSFLFLDLKDHLDVGGRGGAVLWDPSTNAAGSECRSRHAL